MLGWIAEQCSLPATAAGVCTADSRTSDILCVMAAKQAHGTADKKAKSVHFSFSAFLQVFVTV